MCSDCKKEYKTESGLARHRKSKHPKPQDHLDNQENSKSIDESTIIDIIIKALQDIAGDECFPGEIRSMAKQCVFQTHNAEMLTEINKLYQSLCKNSNAEKFYRSFYGTIVVNASIFLHPLKMPVCTMLATRVADKVLAHFNKPKTVLLAMKKINQREFDGLQYLAGYVIHSLVKKIHKHKNCKTKEAQDMLTVLNSARSTNLDSQRLVKCQTRGGLWGVKPELQQMFKIVEEHFRNLENCHTLLIDLKKITRNLMSDVNVVSLFNNVIENSECSIDEEAKVNILQKMIELYLRVRAFSMAKTKTLLESKKARGLRKGIKTQTQKRNEKSS